MFDRYYPLMTVKEAKTVIDKLNQSTILDSVKEEAIRKVMGSTSAFSQLKRKDLVMISEYLFNHYMKEEIHEV